MYQTTDPTDGQFFFDIQRPCTFRKKSVEKICPALKLVLWALKSVCLLGDIWEQLGDSWGTSAKSNILIPPYMRQTTDPADG